ncbi:VOC family protein [Actinomadura rugatobispora]|uniref:VOC family protein n=1 Tax=Actinomadura rugatobispora TaxID=1994 RepID=A0ABW0ZTP8_9ACTN|nr:VOC family protein [Actinomadura rugatobispora]
MPVMTTYEHGAPCWAELSTPNIQRSRDFYCELFGWSVYTMADTLIGDVDILTLGGVDGPRVAGLLDMADVTLSPNWTCYFNVRDLPRAADAVREAGGEVFFEADVGLGFMALAADTEGAGFGLWHPHVQVHRGAHVVDEPNAMCWLELACQDAAAAQDFYGHVLGWGKPTEFQGATSDKCFMWTMTGRPIARLVCADEPPPDRGSPARWYPYFAVADCDASATAAVRLGATVKVTCTETVHGRLASFADPTEATLDVIQLRPRS